MKLEFGSGNANAFVTTATYDGTDVDLASQDDLALAYLEAGGTAVDGVKFTATRQAIATGKGRVYVTAAGKAQAAAPATTTHSTSRESLEAREAAKQAAAQAQAQAALQAAETARLKARETQIATLLAFGRDDEGMRFTDTAQVVTYLEAQRQALKADIAELQADVDVWNGQIANLEANLRMVTDERDAALARIATLARQAQ